jgi:hypothetical protein
VILLLVLRCLTVDGRNPAPGFNHPRWCRISSIHRVSHSVRRADDFWERRTVALKLRLPLAWSIDGERDQRWQCTGPCKKWAKIGSLLNLANGRRAI